MGLKEIWNIVKESATATKANKLAVGVVGVGAAAALVIGINKSVKVAVLGTLIMLGFMTVLLILGWAKKNGPDSKQPIIVVFLWTVLLAFSAMVVLLVTTFAAGWPAHATRVIYGADPDPHGPDPNDQLSAVRREIASLRGAWETMRQGRELKVNPVVRDRVARDAPFLAEKILKFQQGILLGHEIDREEWAGYALFMAADAANLRGESADRDRWVDEGLTHLDNATRLIAEADRLYGSSGDPYYGRLQNYLRDCRDRERVRYLRSMFYALDALTRQKYSKSQALQEFSAIDPKLVSGLEVLPDSTPYLSELLPKE